jgi:hypothetical protein
MKNYINIAKVFLDMVSSKSLTDKDNYECLVIIKQNNSKLFKCLEEYKGSVATLKDD